MILWSIFIVAYAWAIVATLGIGSWTWRFISEHKSIGDERALNAFKSMARWNMYLALAQIVVLATGSICGMLLILTYDLTIGLIATLIANGILLGLGKFFKSIEDRARTLPAATQELANEHHRISETWVHKALPDF